MAPIYEQLVSQLHLIAGGSTEQSDIEDLLLVTRADLGVSNDGLERGDLLRIFINDLDKHLLPTPDKELPTS